MEQEKMFISTFYKAMCYRERAMIHIFKLEGFYVREWPFYFYEEGSLPENCLKFNFYYPETMKGGGVMDTC